MAMTKTEVAAIRAVIKRLRCEPNGRGEPREADYVREALTGPARIYLDTWVTGALECLLPGPNYDPKLARDLAS